MTTNERISKLEDAQEKIRDATMLIGEAVRGTSLEISADAYIINHLLGWSEGTNPYDYTAIPKLIDNLIEEDENEWVQSEQE